MVVLRLPWATVLPVCAAPSLTRRHATCSGSGLTKWNWTFNVPHPSSSVSVNMLLLGSHILGSISRNTHAGKWKSTRQPTQHCLSLLSAIAGWYVYMCAVLCILHGRSAAHVLYSNVSIGHAGERTAGCHGWRSRGPWTSGLCDRWTGRHAGKGAGERGGDQEVEGMRRPKGWKTVGWTGRQTRGQAGRRQKDRQTGGQAMVRARYTQRFTHVSVNIEIWSTYLHCVRFVNYTWRVMHFALPNKHPHVDSL